MKNPLSRVAGTAASVRVLAQSGLLGPYRLDHAVGMGLAAHRYGMSPAGAYAIQAARRRNGVAVVDERGSLTFGQMEERTGTLAAALVQRGIREEARVAVLCRNHRGLIEATVALAKVGADALFLNTGFAGPQVADVLEREGAGFLILDEEFAGVCEAACSDVGRIVAWTEAGGPGGATGWPSIDEIVANGRLPAPPRPKRAGHQIILTSGTTGTPRGASRSTPSSVEPLVAVLSKIPFRSGDITLIAAPMFHAWGLAHLGLGMLFGSTVVLRRRFDPEETLRLVSEENVSVLALVPVMLQRIVELPGTTRQRFDTSSLRVIALSGSALPGDLATRAMNAFGDIVYNLYGSTEVAYATIATPTDLRAAPGTAGRPLLGTTVKLLGDDDGEVAPGQVGRIFVGSNLTFEGYTGGGSKQVLDGLMSVGDVGHLDVEGRLFVDGRDDEMIVSGGENVFPREVEDLLADHPACADVSVIGVPDDEFGQRLKAFVVLRKGEQATASELAAFVGRNLARYKVPRDIEFVEQLPRNDVGKVVKRHLRGAVAAPIPCSPRDPTVMP